MKRIIALVCAIIMTAGVLTACGKKDNDSAGGDDRKTLKIAVLESAYGKKMWTDIASAFEASNNGIKVEVTADKNLEDVIGAKMKSGDYPDFVHLATGREAGLTETMIKGGSLEEITDVFDMEVPGESGKKVRDKIIPGFLDTLATNPYSDGDDEGTYLAPMFYGPCGLFYNAGLFSEKGWTVPETWEEMWELGQKAKTEGIALFTYPTTGYFDAFFYALLCETGGMELYNDCMSYKEGVWESEEAKEAFEIVGQLASYTEKSTVANANNENYLKNQQLILDNKALFMPNGTWVVGEMSDVPRADGFEWGFTALPAVSDDRYSFTFFEQSWIPAEAKNKDLAKQFMAFLYSDEAAKIFAESGAVQPIEGVSDWLEGENKLFYSIYDTGAKAVMGGFAATEAVEGVSMSDTLFGTVNSVVSGDKTVDEWRDDVASASDGLASAKK